MQYLDTQHIHNLTTYLQALHRSGSATADHTSLLLNCYTRLRDTQQLDEFIMVNEEIFIEGILVNVLQHLNEVIWLLVLEF